MKTTSQVCPQDQGWKPLLLCRVSKSIQMLQGNSNTQLKNFPKTEILKTSFSHLFPKINQHDKPYFTYGWGTREYQNRNPLFDRQFDSLINDAFFQLRILSKVKPYLSPNDLETVIHAFSSSRLDYCIVLCIGVDQHLLKRLQLVQNAAVRLPPGTNKRGHITPVLASLH